MSHSNGIDPTKVNLCCQYVSPFKLLGIHLGPGEFVQLKNKKNTFGRILDIKQYKKIAVNDRPDAEDEYDFCILINYFDKVSNNPSVDKIIPGINTTQFKDVGTIPEVYQTFKNKWHNSNEISQICWVFHIDSIQNGTFSCSGMCNVFLVRYSYDGIQTKSLHDVDFRSFPQYYKSCTERIFRELRRIHDVVKKPLSSRRIYPLLGAKELVNITLPTWKYILILVGNKVQQKGSLSTKSSLRRISPADFALLTCPVNEKKYCFRVQTELECEHLRSCFGSTFGVGRGTKYPSMKMVRTKPSKARVSIFCHDDVRMIIANNNNQQHNNPQINLSKAFVYKTLKKGIDFIYNTQEEVLELRMRFNEVRGDAAAVNNAFCATPVLEAGRQKKDDQLSCIIPGAIFYIADDAFQINTIEGNSIKATHILNDDVQQTFPLETVKTLLLEEAGYRP